MGVKHDTTRELQPSFITARFAGEHSRQRVIAGGSITSVGFSHGGLSFSLKDVATEERWSIKLSEADAAYLTHSFLHYFNRLPEVLAEAARALESKGHWDNLEPERAEKLRKLQIALAALEAIDA